MTLEQLQIFLAVSNHLHFTRAAEQLYITQPAVSAAIQKLELEYGIKLFHRIGRRIELTDAGHLLQIEGRKILEQVAYTERNLREFNNLQRGRLKLGASLTIGNYWLPEKISQFKQQYPGIDVDCALSNADEICEGTALGRFDLGLVTGNVKPTLKNVLENESVGTDRLLIVVGKAHPWFTVGTVALEDLVSTKWVMREVGSGAQKMFEQTLETWEIKVEDLEVELTLNSSEMVKAVVESGVCAAALPELMVEKELRLSSLRAITIIPSQAERFHAMDIVQPILKIKHKQRFKTKTIIAFENILSSF
jgi:DNA-binding transcriptional LysR family regulator